MPDSGKTLLAPDKYLKTPDGALLRYKHWRPTTPSDIKPRLLILPGRATFIEKFGTVIKSLRSRGYEVWIFDWRGQGLSTREAGRRGYISDYKVYMSDLDLIIKTFFKNENQQRPMVVLGQSMGSHIGLRYMAENPGVIDGAVMTAPMLDLNTGIYAPKIAEYLTRLMVALGFGKSYVFSHGDYDPATEPFEGNLLTHNKEIFYYLRHLQMERPELVVGGATFGWVKATIDSIQKMMRPDYLGRIQDPVHIYAAGEEKVVCNKRLELAASWIPQCEVEVIENARHQLLSECLVIRNRIYRGLDQFVSKNYDLPITDREMQDVIVPDLQQDTAFDPAMIPIDRKID